MKNITIVYLKVGSTPKIFFNGIPYLSYVFNLMSPVFIRFKNENNIRK